MLFSAYDSESGLYYYYAGSEDYWSTLPMQYREPVFMPFQEIKFSLPNGATPVGSGSEPKGVIVSDEQIDKPTCSEDKDWLWIALSFLAGKLLFKG